MVDKHYIAVVNPLSGARRGADALAAARAVFAAAGARLDVHVTQYPGHAAGLVEALDLSECDGLCVAGGDGTLHEVVRGLMRREHPAAVPLGLIPAGTGNSVAAHLGIASPGDAARRILAGNTQPLDVARAVLGERVEWCVNIIGWGFAVDINRTAERLRGLGPSRYTIAALWSVLRARPRRARVILDGRVLEGEFLFAIACNTKFTGKGMKLAPGAELGDGVWDVVLARGARRIEILKMLVKVYDGSHAGMPCIQTQRVRSFAIEPEVEGGLNLDGELTGTTPVAVEVIPGGLRIF